MMPETDFLSLRRISSVSSRRALSGRGGFTLLEVLVAFTILALTTLVVQRTVVTAVDGSARAKSRLGAEMVARTLSTVPLLAGGIPQPMSGTMEQYAWTARFTPVDLPFATNVTSDGKAPAWLAVRMTLRVSGAAAGSAGVTIDVIRLVRAAPG